MKEKTKRGQDVDGEHCHVVMAWIDIDKVEDVGRCGSRLGPLVSLEWCLQCERMRGATRSCETYRESSSLRIEIYSIQPRSAVGA
jgi:hypothetical protein